MEGKIHTISPCCSHLTGQAILNCIKYHHLTVYAHLSGIPCSNQPLEECLSNSSFSGQTISALVSTQLLC